VVDWTNTIPALTDAGFRVIAFDRPPFGLSDKRTDLDYSTQAMSDLTAGVMDTLNIEKAVIVGHSLGGAVASQFVLDYPARVSRLVLVDAAIGIMGSNPQFDMRPDGGGRNNGNNTGVEFLSRVNPDSLAAQALVRGMFSPEFANNMMSQSMALQQEIDPSELQRRTRGLQIKGWEGGVLAFTRDAFSDKSEIDLDAFKTVQTPVLIIWGQEDRIVPIEIGEALRDLFPHNTWITYPQVGHTVMDENTTQFNADLVAFASAN
jgi:pimeloyl-ACP methyl ester carboxylesterase